MSAYQLSCGHWQSDPGSYEIGGILWCTRCNLLKVRIIGAAARVRELTP